MARGRAFITKDFLVSEDLEELNFKNCVFIEHAKSNDRSYHKYVDVIKGSFIEWDIYFEGNRAEFMDRLHLQVNELDEVLLA